MSSPDRSRELDQVCALLTRYYVFPDVGEQVVELVQRQHCAGAFPGVSTDEEFGIAVTHAMQTVNGDRHLRLLHSVDEILEQDDEDAEVFDKVSSISDVAPVAPR